MQRHSDLAFCRSLRSAVLATQARLLPDKRTVRLVHLLLYEAAQFLDEFVKMRDAWLVDRDGQMPLRSLLQENQDVPESMAWFVGLRPNQTSSAQYSCSETVV